MGDARYVAKEVVDAFNAHDHGRIRALYAENARFEAPGGIAGGADDAADYNMGWLNAFPDATATVRSELIDGDWIVHELEFSGTHKEPLAGPGGTIPATGKQVKARGVDAIRIADGKIVEEHLYFDQIGILSQLGIAPEPSTT